VSDHQRISVGGILASYRNEPIGIEAGSEFLSFLKKAFVRGCWWKSSGGHLVPITLA